MEYKTSRSIHQKKFQIKELPKYLLVHIKRFTKNTFFVEKNPTIVTFPVRNLRLRDYLAVDPEVDPGLYRYDLVANIVHEGLPGAGKGTYLAQTLHAGTEEWFETQDLHVVDILPQMITLATSYIQVWERQVDSPEDIAADIAARAPLSESTVPSVPISDGNTTIDGDSAAVPMEV